MALKFTAPTGFLSNGSLSAVDGTVTGNISLFGWVNMQTVAGTVILGCFNSLSTESYYIEYNNAFSSFRATWVSGGSFTGVNSATGGASTNTWYSIGSTFSFSGGNITPVIWRNGVRTAGSATASARPTGLSVTNIGAYGGTPTGFYPSSFGLCAAWNEALSDLEMQALSAGASPFIIRPDKLVGVWDPTNMAVVPDLSGKLVNLTLNGTPTEVVGGPRSFLFPLAPAPQLEVNQAVTATDFTLSTPPHVVAGQTTASISISPNGVVGTANCTLAFGDGGAGGTFTPTSQTINNGSGSAVSFTYTVSSGASPGAITITVTAGGGSTIPNGTAHTTTVTVDASATGFNTSGSPLSIATGGTSTITYTLNAPSPFGGVVVTPTLSGTPGGSCSPSTVSIAVGNTVGTTTYTAGGSAGTETIGGTSVPSLTQLSSVNIGVSSSPLATGTLSVTTTVPGLVTLASTAPTGGSPPYRGQIHRSNINLPGMSTAINVANLSTGTAAVPSPATLKAGVAVLPPVWGSSQTIYDNGARHGETYYYQMAYTDSAGAFVLSNQVNTTLPPLVIGFIGDSITNGDHSTSGTGVIGNATAATLGGATGQCQQYLKTLNAYGTVTVNKQGVPGARAADWVSGSSNLNTAISAFSGAGVNVIHAMLGTNDATTNSGGPQTPAQVKTSLASMIGALKASFPGVPIILSCPPWMDGARGATSGLTGYGSGTLAVLNTYLTSYLSLVDGVSVFAGDFTAINLFTSSNEGSTSANGLLFDGVHPNDSGYQLLGTAWGRAIDRVMYQLREIRAGNQQGGL